MLGSCASPLLNSGAEHDIDRDNSHLKILRQGRRGWHAALGAEIVSMRLEGKRAIVTGGASGIGAAIAERLAADGARVLIADTNYTGARQLVASLSARQLTVCPVEVDVASAASVKSMIDACVDQFGGLDVLVN